MLSTTLAQLKDFKLILGSQSENRQTILKKTGIINFETKVSNFAEDLPHKAF